jgi:hypothetical protein
VAESLSQTEGRNGMKKPLGVATGLRIVLSFSHNDEDCAPPQPIFESGFGSWSEMLERVSPANMGRIVTPSLSRAPNRVSPRPEPDTLNTTGTSFRR